MRKNHISGKMKRILAVACAAMLAVSSVPANTVAYASEAETTQEAEVQNDNKGAGENNDVDNTNESNVVTNDNSENGKSGEEASESGKSGEETSESGKSGVETSESSKSGEETSESGKSGKETSESGKSGEETSESGQSGKDNKNDKEPEQDTTNPKVTAVELSEDKIKITIDEEPSEDGWTISCKKDGEIKTKDKITGKSFTIDPKEYWNEDGTYTDFQINGEDASGNPLEFGEGLKDKLNGIKITIDTDAPTVTAVKLLEDKIELTIDEAPSKEGWTVSCKKDGEVKTKEKISGQKVTIDPQKYWGEDGTYTDFQISGEDASGNSLEFGEGLEEKLSNIEIKIDISKPIVSNATFSIEPKKEKDNVKYFDQDVTISFSLSEAITDTDTQKKWTVNCIKDGNEETPVKPELNWADSGNSFTITLNEEGNYTDFSVKGSDAAGNDAVDNSNIAGVIIDKNSPTIKNFSMTETEFFTYDGVYIGRNNVTVEFDFDDVTETSAWYFVSENGAEPEEGNWTQITKNGEHYSFIIPMPEDGKEGRLYIKGEDELEHITQNEGEDYYIFKFILEKIPPQLEVSVDNNDPKKTHEFTIKAHDDGIEGNAIKSGLQTIKYKVDNANDWSEITLNGDSSYNGIIRIDDPNLTGTHTVEFQAIDRAKNSSEIIRVSAVFDNTAPTYVCVVDNKNVGRMIDGVLTFNKTAMEFLGETGVQISFTVTEDNMKLDGWSYEYKCNNKTLTANIPNDSWKINGNKYTYTFSVKEPGYYKDFKLNGVDTSDNPATGTSTEFVISTEEPTINLVMSKVNTNNPDTPEDESLYHNDGGFTVAISSNLDGSGKSHINGYEIKVIGKGKTYIKEKTSGFSQADSVVKVKIGDEDLKSFFGDFEGELIVTITASTKAGNSTQRFTAGSGITIISSVIDGKPASRGAYFYDNVKPKLMGVASDAGGAEFFDGEDGFYYVSSNKVTDTYTISDAYLGITTVEYFKDEETADNKVTEKTTGEKLEVTLEGEDNKFFKFKVSGKDLAGNTIELDPNYTSDPANVNAAAATADGINLKNGKVLDTVAPELVSISSDAGGKTFYDGEDGLYYVSAGTVTDTYTISDTNLSKSKVSYKKDDADAEPVEGEETVVVTLEGEGEYTDFVIAGADKAGNKIKIADDYESDPENVNAVEASEESIALTSGKVLDTTGPSVVFEATKRTDPDTLEGVRRYYNTDFNGTFTVTDNNTLFAESINAAVYKAEETENEHYNTHTDENFKKTEDINGDGDQAKTIVYSKDIMDDGNYRFYIKGYDKAHNPIAIAGDQPTGEMGLKSYNDGFISNDKIRDTVKPDAELSVLVDNGTEIYKLIMDPSGYSLEAYKPFQKKIESKVKMETKDKSPVYFIYDIDSTVEEGKESGITKNYVNDANSVTVIPAREQIITIKNLVVKDRAGNILTPISEEDNKEITLLESNQLFFDETIPGADIVAPTATIKATSDVTHRNPDGRPLFNHAVTLTVTVTDPGEGKYSSGLNEASYEVFVDKTLVESNVIKFKTSIDTPILDEHTAGINNYDLTFTSQFTINLPTSYQTNDIEVRVFASDNSGNAIKDPVTYTCGIDTIGPKIKVSYDNNSARNGKYFKANRTATINVIDRNVSNAGVKIDTQGSVEGAFSWHSGRGNGANDSWVKHVYYTKDGDYTLSLNGSTDALGNKATIEYTGTAPQNFVLDKTAPVIVVKFSNDNVQNGKYYKDPRTAHVQITEHNFRASDVSIKTQVTPGGFGGRGDVHTADVYYGTDGVYTMVVNYTDLAGNPAKAVTVDEFVIDRTIPVIYVTFDNNSSQNGKYYKDPRTATVRIHEHNFRASDVKINQTATIQKGSVSAPGVSGFGGGGDDHSASINYSNDGNYTIEVNYTDLAGNPAKVVKVDEFVIDRTKPVVKFVTPDKNNMVFQDAIAPQIEYSDINTTRGMASINLKGMKKSNVLEVVEDTFSNYEGTVRFENLKKVRENDDIYLATAVVTDLAGNEESVSITFSVNRFGSTYDYNNDPFTTDLVQNYFANEEGDVVLREINVNKLTERSLTLYKDGDNRKLVEGTDFKVDENTVNGHYEYIYTIFKANFEEEGNYNIIATSKDEAKNTNSNSSVKGNDGSNEVPLRFAIDKTEPTNEVTGVDITKNKFTESEITLDIRPLDNMNAVAKFLVRVLDKDGNDLMDPFELSGEDLAKYLEEHDGVYQLIIKQNTGWQTIEIVTTDAAGNQSTDYTIADNTAYNVLVTPNLFVQYINRLPLVLLTVAAVAGIIFFIIWKRKKDQEDETAA